MESKELVKTYKNGNKVWRYYETCPVCGGSGYLSIYKHHDNGVCYACNGSGTRTWVEKELTPENEAKQNAEWQKKFEIRQAELLKKEIDLCHKQALIENKRFDQHKAEADASEWQGEVGKRISLNLTLTISMYWETQYGTQYMHLMKDADGNVYKWMTSNPVGYYKEATGNDYSYEDENGVKWDWHNIEEKNAESFTIKGTVKEHSEYKGVKQTVLTRCKVSK